MNGLFITFEGIDGCGKSTQCQLLSAHLNTLGQPHLSLREPGATALGERVRGIVQSPDMTMDMHTEAYLYAAARCELVRGVIKPAIEGGQTVICDRFFHSSLAYQGYARGLGLETVRQINHVAIQALVPHVTFWIDTPLATAQARIQKGELDRIELEGSAFQQKVLEGYRQLATQDSTIITIDGSQSAEHIHAQILTQLGAYR